MKSILDPSFKYTSSINTDLAKTFARIRRAQREATGGAESPAAGRSDNVSALRRPAKRRDCQVA